jgi:hypothetical protein
MIATARGLNTKKYARLLSRTLPVPIESEQEHIEDGKRGITKAQALKLAERFRVTPDLFISWP